MVRNNYSEGVSINGRCLMNNQADKVVRLPEDIHLSFEVFPAKNASECAQMLSDLQPLIAYYPDYISVTYGAAGNNRDGTVQTAESIVQSAHLHSPDTHIADRHTKVMAHLTLAGQSREQVITVSEQFKAVGVQSILALHGDEPKAGKFIHKSGFKSSVELISCLANLGWQSIRTTAYPDKHKNSRGSNADLDWLLAKFDAGASEAITQFFFDADSFFNLRDRLDKYGYGNKITPGILSFSDIPKMQNFAKKCGVSIPNQIAYELSHADAKTSQALCVSILADLWLKLSSEGVKHYHIYTLNKVEPTLSLLELLGVQKRISRKNKA